jgi:hypothetical protein
MRIFLRLTFVLSLLAISFVASAATGTPVYCCGGIRQACCERPMDPTACWGPHVGAFSTQSACLQYCNATSACSVN